MKGIKGGQLLTIWIVPLLYSSIGSCDAVKEEETETSRAESTYWLSDLDVISQKRDDHMNYDSLKASRLLDSDCFGGFNVAILVDRNSIPKRMSGVVLGTGTSGDVTVYGMAVNKKLRKVTEHHNALFNFSDGDTYMLEMDIKVPLRMIDEESLLCFYGYPAYANMPISKDIRLQKFESEDTFTDYMASINLDSAPINTIAVSCILPKETRHYDDVGD